MIRRATIPQLLASLWLLAPTHVVAVEQTPAVEQTDDEEMADSADERWGLRLGVQGDRVSTLGLTGTATYDLFPATTLHGSGGATDYRSDPPVGTPSTPRSIWVDAGITQRFGKFALDGALGHWVATHVLKAEEIKLAGSFSSGGFSGALRTGYRRSTFASFASSAVADFGNGVQGAQVIAACQVKNTSFGVEGRWEGRTFGVHGSMMSNQYANARCGLTAPGIGTASASLGEAAFAGLAGDPLSRLANTALPVIGEQPALARSVGRFGVSYRRKDKGVSVDYLRQQDNYLSSTGTAIFATATAYLGGSTGLDVTFGRAQGGSGPGGLFGGLGLRARF